MSVRLTHSTLRALTGRMDFASYGQYLTERFMTLDCLGVRWRR